MSKEENGSKTWMILVRILFIVLTFFNGILLWWVKGITVKTLDTETKVAVHDSVIKDVKESLFQINTKLDRLMERRVR